MASVFVLVAPTLAPDRLPAAAQLCLIYLQLQGLQFNTIKQACRMFC